MRKNWLSRSCVPSEHRNPANQITPIRLLAPAFFLLVLFSLPCTAQDIPRVQVFGGYSYTRFDSRSFGFANASDLNGWNVSPAFNIWREFGVKAEASGQYGSKLNLRDYAFGPQFLYPRGKMIFFGHLLVGTGRSFVRVGTGERDRSRAIALGGGVDWDVSSHFAFRLVQADYIHTSLFGATQKNLRVSTGLVYKWGAIHKGHKPLAP